MKVALSVVAACGTLVAAAPVDQTRALVRPLPDALAARPVDAAAIAAIASGTMADLARILAEHEISAGLVFTQDERRQTEHAQRRTGAMVPIGDVVAQFTAAYPSYAAGTTAGVPFFGPDDSDCVRALRRPPPLVMTARVTLRRQSISVLDAFQEIARQAPGLVWWIAEDPNRYPNRMACIVNEFYPGGASFTSHDINAKGQASRTRT